MVTNDRCQIICDKCGRVIMDVRDSEPYKFGDEPTCHIEDLKGVDICPHCIPSDEMCNDLFSSMEKGDWEHIEFDLSPVSTWGTKDKLGCYDDYYGIHYAYCLANGIITEKDVERYVHTL